MTDVPSAHASAEAAEPEEDGNLLLDELAERLTTLRVRGKVE
jgi:hypothetical protein